MFSERLASLDLALFDPVPSQTSEEDKRSLLALHAAIADRLGEFAYLEIGSHLGGSLQVLATDDRCRRIVSIDPRPEWQPDDRLGVTGFSYPENSTQAMLDRLAAIPGADVQKIEPLELGSDQIDPASVARPDFCFVDGEHTHDAVLRDARFCRSALRGRGVIAFHDFAIVPSPILRFLRETRGARGYRLRDEVFVVEIGIPTLLSDHRVRGQLRGRAHVWRPLAMAGAPALLRTSRRLRKQLEALRHLAGRYVNRRRLR